ncbi:hypothetical protein [Aestuariivirga sp.]|uniref:hypothetical protein n=1 Tax=Aestuariivirga sp. TaxID=2650926 RepID=UPI0035B04D08
MEQVNAILVTHGDMLLLGAVFFAVTFLTFAFASLTRSWSSLRRRVTANVVPAVASGPAAPATLQHDSGPDYLKGLVPTDEARKSELVKFLNSAGYYGNRALVLFQASRLLTALVFGILTAVMFGRLYPDKPIVYTIIACVGLTFVVRGAPSGLSRFPRLAGHLRRSGYQRRSGDGSHQPRSLARLSLAGAQPVIHVA